MGERRFAVDNLVSSARSAEERYVSQTWGETEKSGFPEEVLCFACGGASVPSLAITRLIGPRRGDH